MRWSINKTNLNEKKTLQNKKKIKESPDSLYTIFHPISTYIVRDESSLMVSVLYAYLGKLHFS